MNEEKQSEAARERYAYRQMQMRQWNKEMNEFAKMQEQYSKRGEEPPYKTLGAFRRAYRSEEGTLAYAKSHYYRRDEKQYEEFVEILGAHRMHETLARFQEMKYNKGEEFELFVGFEKANKKRHISPLVSFDVYKQVSKEIDEKFVGKVFDGVEIKGKKTHFIDRIIGEYQESDYKQSGKRQGVPIVDALAALQKPISKIERINEDKSISLTFVGENCKVTVNPKTGMLIQSNRRRTKK